LLSVLWSRVDRNTDCINNERFKVIHP
jgi:hypothetical protein